MKHQKNCGMKIQQKLCEMYTGNAFNSNLCQASVSADIPVNNLSNGSLKSFLEKYKGHSVLDQSTIRKTTLEETLSKQ